MNKKRIKIQKRSGELWNRMFCQTTFRMTSHGEEHVINLEGFGQILDEARKDFPLCSGCKFENCHFKNQHATLYSLCPPRENWLVKWWALRFRGSKTQ